MDNYSKIKKYNNHLELSNKDNIDCYLIDNITFINIKQPDILEIVGSPYCYNTEKSEYKIKDIYNLVNKGFFNKNYMSNFIFIEKYIKHSYANAKNVFENCDGILINTDKIYRVRYSGIRLEIMLYPHIFNPDYIEEHGVNYLYFNSPKDAIQQYQAIKRKLNEIYDAKYDFVNNLIKSGA
ncbi:MAG: hypothetical protein M0P71_07400 [Melioribacteraceae bacterium]|jgi:hypothetical protein|nr:hypothetical protein [Melioribacteraceae bacterium]MDD3982820.1 hypothetical protein [Candidatus Omnitrophota bacterium]